MRLALNEGWARLEDLRPWDKNPRRNESAVLPVARAIEELGWGAPIVAQRGSGRIVAGHTRFKAAAHLKTQRWSPETGSWIAREGEWRLSDAPAPACVPVRWVEISDAKASALALADNRLGEIADWDESALPSLLQDILQADPNLDLELMGWDAGDLNFPEIADETPSDRDESLDDQPVDPPALTKEGDRIEIGPHTLICGSCLEGMRRLESNSVDAIVTDPPYGIGFMGEQWDSCVPGLEWAQECLRILKPGGHVIAFAATRTAHRLAVALEDAGFEIRDVIAWLQWQGFPKSRDVSKGIDDLLGRSGDREVVGKSKNWGAASAKAGKVAYGDFAGEWEISTPASDEARRWQGWGSALKPAQEPAVLARKPLEGTLAKNVLKWGTGAINIDGCRYLDGDDAWPGPQDGPGGWGGGNGFAHTHAASTQGGLGAPAPRPVIGRWPANIYACPKPSVGEKNEVAGEALPAKRVAKLAGAKGKNLRPLKQKFLAEPAVNHHPTVKPVRLMRWLLRLVTPPSGVVVEPFAGSGTTLVAAQAEGFRCIAFEKEPAFCDISRARLDAAMVRFPCASR